MKKKCASILIAALLVLMVLPMSALATQGDIETYGGIHYTITNMPGYLGPGSNGTVEIGNNQAYSSTPNVVIPATITVTDNAQGNAGTYDVVNIASGAFFGTEISTLTIPGSVIGIGANAFQGCNSLTTVNLADGLETIGASAFSRTAISTLPARPVLLSTRGRSWVD